MDMRGWKRVEGLSEGGDQDRSCLICWGGCPALVRRKLGSMWSGRGSYSNLFLHRLPVVLVGNKADLSPDRYGDLDSSR